MELIALGFLALVLALFALVVDTSALIAGILSAGAMFGVGLSNLLESTILSVPFWDIWNAFARFIGEVCLQFFIEAVIEIFTQLLIALFSSL